MRLLSVGDLNVDIILYVEKIPAEGGEEHAKGISISPGGSAANVAVAFSRLGGESWFFGTVGGDVFGSWILERLREERINVKYVRVCRGCGTGTMVILSTSKDRTIIGFRGANERLARPDSSLWENEFDALFISGYSFLGDNYQIARGLVKDAANRGIKVFIDASGIFAKIGLETLRSLGVKIHGLLLNESEARDFFKGSDPSKYLWVADEIVVKMGEQGAKVYSGSGSVHVPAFKVVRVVDTTGAGDVFDAAYIYATLRGLSARDKLVLANAAAAIKITRKGGWSSPYRSELQSFLLEKNKKIRI